MGFFRGLGRRAERFKQQVVAAADATHECADCGASFGRGWDECPECGSGGVVELN